VDIPAVMDVLETAKDLEWVMVELGWQPGRPYDPFETAKATRNISLSSVTRSARAQALMPAGPSGHPRLIGTLASKDSDS